MNSRDNIIKEVCSFLNATVYERSIHETEDGLIWVGAIKKENSLFVIGAETGFTGVLERVGNTEVLIAPLTHENAEALRKAFPFTAPVRVLNSPRTMGVGDRLGIATPGHIRVFS